MDTNNTPETINHQRRHFLGAAAITMAAAGLGLTGPAAAQSARAIVATNTSFAPLKQIEAGVLNVGYAEAGPATGPGFQLQATVEAEIPGVDETTARALLDAAHQVCPYSNATRGNIDVTLNVV